MPVLAPMAVIEPVAVADVEALLAAGSNSADAGLPSSGNMHVKVD